MCQMVNLLCATEATAPQDGTSSVNDGNEPRNTAPVPNQNPEPDDYSPCDEDSDNMYDKYDNNNPYEPGVAECDGDSDSDLLDESMDEGEDDDLGYQIDATYRRKCSYKKHKEYSAKGKAMISWLEQEIKKGEDLSVQELKGDWHLYSIDTIKSQQKTCQHPHDVNFGRGKLSITYHDAENGTGYDGFLGHIALVGRPDGLTWNVSGYTPSSVSPNWRLYTAEEHSFGRPTGMYTELKMTFCGNGYMTMTLPATAMGGAEGEEEFIFTGVFSEKTKVEKEMEWAKEKGKWFYCGQFDDGDDDDEGPFCYANYHNKTCYDEDCDRHVGDDRTPMTHSKKSRMPRRRPRPDREREGDTEGSESDFSDTEEAHEPSYMWSTDY
ncbi:hypothetical protein P3342_013226 [Pyrenophora teres f. teres]|nr:hypothetical protein P3342_013226 [Pyrenophora teres f. teres]